MRGRGTGPRRGDGGGQSSLRGEGWDIRLRRAILGVSEAVGNAMGARNTVVAGQAALRYSQHPVCIVGWRYGWC